LPRPRDWKRVEEWPDDARESDSLVAELAMNSGVYLTGNIGWDSTTCSLDDALLFSDVEEAERFIATLNPRPAVMLQFRAACVAEWDQREAAAVDGRQVV
jgi:hypothetical protein